LPYLILKNCVAAAARRRAGDIVHDISDDEARSLVNMGRVEFVEAAAKPVETNRSVGLETSETPTPKRRRRTRSED
jgi:hypothetical protein